MENLLPEPVLLKSLLPESVLMKNLLTESVLMNFLSEAVPVRGHNICFFQGHIWKRQKSQINYQKLPLFRGLVLFISVTKLSVSRIYAFRSNKMPTSFVRSEYTKPKMNTISQCSMKTQLKLRVVSSNVCSTIWSQKACSVKHARMQISKMQKLRTRLYVQRQPKL